MLPDHTFTLIEPMERRCEWLSECVETMGLENVQIVRARSEEAIAALEQARGKSSTRPCQEHGDSRGGAGDTASVHRGDLPGGRADDEADRMDIAARGAAWRAHCAEGTPAGAEIEKARKVIAQYGGRHARVKEAEVAPGLEPTHVLIVDKQ